MSAFNNPFLRRAGHTAIRVSHRGAAALAAPNSLEAIRQAVRLEVEMVEFDVIRRDGRLVLGHPGHEAREGILSGAAPPMFEEAVALLSEAAPETKLQVDVKQPAYEEQVVAVLSAYGVLERTLASSTDPSVLNRLKHFAPGLHVARSYPADRLGLSRFRSFTPVVRGSLSILRALLPMRLPSIVGDLPLSALMLNHDVLSRVALEWAHVRGIAVFAWTVDDEAALERVLAAGVDGVIMNDPRILASVSGASRTDDIA